MSDQLPRSTSRPLQFDNGTAIGISNRWERGQYCSILTRAGIVGCGIYDLEVAAEFGLLSRVVSNALGPVLLWSARREERRLAAGHTYEPATIIERRNWDIGLVEQRRPPALVTLPQE